MISGSLRLRLIAAASLAIALALAASGVVISRLFTAHVEARVDAELITHLNQLIANFEVDADGALQLTVPPADPRFLTPNGGLYWQVDLPDGGRQRSRSLWESVLPLPEDALEEGALHRHEIDGPGGARLRSVERAVTLGPDTRLVPMRVTVALDRREIDEAAAGFRAVLINSLAVLGVALLAALLVQVQVGLRPLAMLRRALNRVHTGEHDRIGGDFPSEIRPLVEDMNALLARERHNIERARQQAGDLAHGFKTPLAVLGAVAHDLKRDGRLEAVKEIERQVDMMGRHVKAVLAHSRIAGAVAIGQKPIPIAPVVVRVVGALRRIAVDRNLNWTTEVPAAAMFAGDENDLMEIVGNVADNAAKWATSKVLIEAKECEGWLVIRCEDDGPGLPPGTEAALPARGRRLDEARGGTGLGLSIVAKIVEAYAGTITLGPSALGGLAVTVSIPMPGVGGPRSQSSSK